jgi:hypothetical protein
MIQGAPIESIAHMFGRSDILQNYSSNRYIFSTYTDPIENVDLLFYSLKNVGKVPANNITHTVKAFFVDEDTEKRTEITLPNETSYTKRGVIFPDDTPNVRTTNLGENILHNTSKGKYLDVSITVNYNGVKELDDNNYFTYKTIRIPIEDVSSNENIITQIIDNDEGIES